MKHINQKTMMKNKKTIIKVKKRSKKFMKSKIRMVV